MFARVPAQSYRARLASETNDSTEGKVGGRPRGSPRDRRPLRSRTDRRDHRPRPEGRDRCEVAAIKDHAGGLVGV